MAVTLGPVAPLTKEEKELAQRLKALEEENPLIFHQCSVPTADEVPKDAKERQVWTCPQCSSKFRLHYMDGLDYPKNSAGEPDTTRAFTKSKQVSWVKIA